MKKLNLTELSLRNKSLVYYFILVVFVMGCWSYFKLGRMEDPDFVIRQMSGSTAWPGATARQVEEQVTDKIEKKLQDTPCLLYTSYKIIWRYAQRRVCDEICLSSNFYSNR